MLFLPTALRMHGRNKADSQAKFEIMLGKKLISPIIATLIIVKKRFRLPIYTFSVITENKQNELICMKKLLLLVPLVFTASVQASGVTVGQVCKAASAAMFGRDHKIMQLDKVESGIAYVHYIRQNDGTRWAIKCKLIGDQVMWASDNPDITGRWRDDPADSTVKYSIDGKKIIITELYTDGSSTTNSYPMMQLK